MSVPQILQPPGFARASLPNGSSWLGPTGIGMDMRENHGWWAEENGLFGAKEGSGELSVRHMGTEEAYHGFSANRLVLARDVCRLALQKGASCTYVRAF